METFLTALLAILNIVLNSINLYNLSDLKRYMNKVLWYTLFIVSCAMILWFTILLVSLFK